MITVFSDRYTDEHRQLADVLSQAYQPTNNRSSVISVNGKQYQYFPELSTDFYAHYENQTKIIVAVHGAAAVEEQIVALQQSISVGGENEVIDAFCKKYESLLSIVKPILLIGHSLGCFAIGQCAIRFGKDYESLMLAPYVPKPFGRYANKIRTTRLWKKILYRTDWFANNLIKENPPLSNVNVFKNKCLFCFNFLNSHGLFNFTKSIQEINGDIFKFYP